MDTFRIPVVKIGGGYPKAILPKGQETVWGRDEKELAGRLKGRTDVSHVHPRLIEQALNLVGRK
jgi:hypothetical protein